MSTLNYKESNVKKVEYVTKTSPAKVECEDAYIINESLDLYGVLDGSTPMNDFKDEAGHNGAYLAAHLFKDYFESLKATAGIQKEVLQANKLLKKAMENDHVDQTEKHRLWCTCVSVVQVKENILTYASLGDTMILTCDKHGNVNVLTVDTVKNVSARAKITREMDRNKGKDIPEESYFEDQKNRNIYQRKMANVPNGYSVANGMPEVEYYLQYGALNTKNLSHVLIMSDGMFDPKGDLREVYWEIEENGLESYVKKRSAMEEERNIHSDDKTAILLHF